MARGGRPARVLRRRRRPAAAAKRPSGSLVELEPLQLSAQERERARETIRRLKSEHPDARVMLEYRNPWELAVATILAAQCTDARVNQVTPELFARYGDARAMAKADTRSLEKLVRPTGFYRNKARAIREMSRAVVERHGGELPRTMAELLALPGLGRKTANVILGNAFKEPAGVVVDTHNIRLSNLLGFVRTTDPVEIERFWISALDRSDWTICGHLLYAHGQKVCIARRPRCGECVLRDLCPSAGRG